MAIKSETMESLFSVPRVIDGHLVMDERDIYAVFEIRSKLNPITADSRDMAASVRRFKGALDGLQAGERFQVLVDCRRYDPDGDILKMNSMISLNAVDGFRTVYPLLLEKYLKSYCALSMVPEFRYYILFGYRPIKMKIAGEEKLSLSQKINEVDRRAKNFMASFTDSAVSARPLTERELLELLDAALNPSRLSPLSGNAFSEAPVKAGLNSSQAELLFRSPLAHPAPRPGRRYDHLLLGTKLVKTMGFLRAPSENAHIAIEDLILSQAEFRFSYHIEGLNQEFVKETIQKKRTAAAGAVSIGGGKNTQGSEEQAKEYDIVLRKAERREVRFCKWSGYLSFPGNEEGELQLQASELASSLSEMVPDEGVYRQIEYWQSSLPLGEDKAKMSLFTETSGLSHLYPFFDFNSSSPEGGILLGFSPANQPVFYDPWSKIVANGNVFVTGQAGSGKSFLIGSVLNRLGPQAYDVSIIDKAKSYKFSCQAMHGDYIEWDLDGRYAVNVWDVLDYDPRLVLDGQDFNDVDEAGNVGPEKIEQVLGLAEIFMAEHGQSMGKVERSILLESIQETYRTVAARNKAKHPGPGMSRENSPTFSDLAERLENSISKDPEGQYVSVRRDLLQKLRPAISGPLAGLVNRRSTLDIKGRVRVFDISNLPERDEIQGVAMYILTTWLTAHWRRNKANNIRQIAVLDEMYFFMLFAAGRRLLDNLARRSRHLGLMCFFATQQFDDVLLYPETSAILRNSDTKILFRQDKSVIEKVASALNLSDQERIQLENLRQIRNQYSNAFFIYGSLRNIITIRPDPATRWLNTTEPTYDVPRRNKALEQAGGDPWEALQILINQEG